MTADDPFLSAILAAPDDDLPRLIYADWLDETGGAVECRQCNGRGSCRHRSGVQGKAAWFARTDCDACRGTGTVPDGRAARAEFIRVQVELARPCGPCIKYQGTKEMMPAGSPEWCPKHDPLRRREGELLTAARAINWGPDRLLWDAGLKTPIQTLNFVPELLPGYTGGELFRRGFVAEITCTAADWLAHADALLAACPIRGSRDGLVRLRTMPEIEYPGGGLARIEGRAVELCPIRAVTADGAGLTEQSRWACVVYDLLTAEWPGVRFEPPARPETWELLTLDASNPLINVTSVFDELPRFEAGRPEARFTVRGVHATPGERLPVVRCRGGGSTFEFRDARCQRVSVHAGGGRGETEFTATPHTH